MFKAPQPQQSSLQQQITIQEPLISPPSRGQAYCVTPSPRFRGEGKMKRGYLEARNLSSLINPLKKETGSALITSLFIMTLITIAATAMTMRLQLDIYRTRLTLTTDKLNYASQSVVFWAMGELSNNKNRYFTADLNGKVAEFPKALGNSFPPFKLSGELYDLQSRFNINNTVDINYFMPLLRLLDDPKIALETNEKKRFIITLNQWLNNYQPKPEASPGSTPTKDATLTYTLSQTPPYLPAHQLLRSISELRLIEGVTPALYKQLVPKLSALPQVTPLNINTMPPQLLSILGYGLSEEQVNTVLKKRGKTGINKPEKLNLLLKRLNIRPDQVTINSQYFLCVSTLGSADLTRATYTILKRTEDEKGNITVALLSESFNTL